MIMSSAYIFGRQISPGGIPPMAEDIYFENGRFNPLYVPQGFDFENNVIRISSEREEEFNLGNFRTASIFDFENGVHADHLDDGTTFLINSYAANNTESFTLDHNTGYLVFDHPSYRKAVDRKNAYAEIACIVPVSNLVKTFDYICMRCRYVAPDNIENQSTVSISIYKKEGGSLSYEGEAYVDINYDLYGEGWVDFMIDKTYMDYSFDFLRLEFNARLESRDFPIGDIPFQIEVSKIWFTNTQPE